MAQRQENSGVVIVLLRQPKQSKAGERRTDPLWEHGSFGCTGCHRKSLLHPRRLHELNGLRFAFAQGGPDGMKLVHVTPPVQTKEHRIAGEVCWQPADMPLTYASAPTLMNNDSGSDCKGLLKLLEGVNRDSPVARFASRFRTRRAPLPPDVGKEIIDVYKSFRTGAAEVSKSYVDAMPWPSPHVDPDRSDTYRRLQADIS